MLATGLETGSHQCPAPPQAPDELGFIFGGDRCLPYQSGQGDPWRFGQMLSGGALQLGSTQPGHPSALSALDNGQAVGVLELGAHPGEGLWSRQMSTLLPSIAHQRTRRCGCAGCRSRSSRDRPPPRPPAVFLTLEPQRLHDYLAYLCPFLVAELAIPGGKRQRKVLEMPAHRIRAVGVVGLIEGRSEISDLLG